MQPQKLVKGILDSINGLYCVTALNKLLGYDQ